ncbi:MAG: helix-turn-helix domain-containing protein [Flammeovirgaceae bacterium]
MSKKFFFENKYILATKTLYNSTQAMDLHAHDNAAISYVIQGRNIETVDAHQKVIGQNSLIIKPKGILHENQYFDNCLILCIYIKPDLNLSYEASKTINEWSSISSFNFLPFLELFQPNHGKGYTKSIIKVLLEKFAEKLEQEKKPPVWLIEIKNIIESSFQETITTQALATYSKKHPVYLTRAFKRYFGFGIKEYLNLQRSNAAFAHMIMDKPTLSQIAYDCGYSDQSHMNRKLKEFSGFTPSQLNKLLD